jgi:heme/copper-type cytochrome/quinol oxidase subunit 1
VGLAAVFVTPVIYLAWGVASVEYRKLFTWLMQWGGGLAITPFALGILWGITRGPAASDAARPLRAALVASLALFGIGGGIGFVIHGSNVTIPAHYHGCIVGVTLALMGLVYHLLPQLGWRAPQGRLAVAQPVLYAAGQLMHIVGLVWSGGYGVQRKVAGSEQVLRSAGEIAGMGLMGLGGLVAIVGGLLFVVVVFGALRSRSAARSRGR